uniref:MFS domain-containing protein n=1 Tax=Steinernema glaseri TaxID=37863 RepID=A0A1I7ZK24_9BILA
MAKLPFWQTLKLFVIGIVLTSITNFPSAFTHTSVNTAVRELNTYINDSFIERGNELDNTDVSLLRSTINSCWYVGQVFGAIFSPYITDTYGRKVGYLLSTFAMAVACALQMVSTLLPYPELLITGRVLAATFSPLSDAALVLYLQEMAPTHLRGMLGSLFANGYAMMCLLGIILGIKEVLGDSLTKLLAVPVIPGFLALLFLLWIPETPKFLMITKQDRAAAKKSLQFFQGEHDECDDILDEYMCETKNEPGAKGNILDLFVVVHLRKALVLALMVFTLTLPFYPILQSSTFFFLVIELPPSIAQISSTIIMGALMISCIVATAVIENVSRRSMLIFSGILSIFALISFIVCASFVGQFSYAKYGAFLSLMGYIIAYGTAIGPISWFIAPELVPQSHRASMFCICYGLHSIFVVLTNFLTIPLFETVGPIVFAPLFIVPSALAILYIYLYLPETKDKETHEIVYALRGGRRKVTAMRSILESTNKF